METISAIMQELRQEKVDVVKSVLSNSDIVWGRYDSDTIDELAKRIIKELDSKEEED